ncbi:MAG: peptide ABC transporter substrate-binding protein [Anaerolineae bacterium]|nr:peptide ABC transporter substrate-binding protein [Anaerolineae bacterium]MDK1081544.1 peptide ABC transporter substrate-binding protein [Anaerolineae bacterium]MDK1118154.1 peptide ABC transporter substrate-binding protein [Anaerolineae bacterium]
MRKLYITFCLLIALSMLLTACGATGGAGQDLKILYTSFSGEGDVPTLDPAIAEDTSSIQIIEETFIGLTNINEVTSAVEPGMATDWEETINSDGTVTITFNMRDDVSWVRWNGEEVEKVKSCDGDDRMVTASDFAYGIQRNQDPAVASPYAYLLGIVLKGAAEFNSGETSDFSTVGVDVIDDSTIALTFLAPAAYNSQIAGLWVARPQPKWLIEGDECTEAVGERWGEAEFFQSYGPFTLKEWIHDSSLTIVKNPFWPGTDEIPVSKIDEINFKMLDVTVQFAEYEAGTIDASDVPLDAIDRIKADPVLSKEYLIAPEQCSYFYGFNNQAEFTNDVRVRRALSLAVDRQSLVDNVTKGGQEPAQWFSRPGLAAAPTIASHPDLGISFDAEAAQAELQSYLDDKGITAADVDLTLLFNTSSTHQKIAEAIQQMWKDTLDLDVKLINQEFAVFLETTDGPNAPQIFRSGWCLDYPDANNFIRDVFASGGNTNAVDADGTLNGIQWVNEDFDELVIAAALESDPAIRLAMYAEAEEILVDKDAAIAPIYWYSLNKITKPYIIRTYGVTGHEAYEKWDILPH